jgi:hypothetical protein
VEGDMRGTSSAEELCRQRRETGSTNSDEARNPFNVVEYNGGDESPSSAHHSKFHFIDGAAIAPHVLCIELNGLNAGDILDRSFSDAIGKGVGPQTGSPQENSRRAGTGSKYFSDLQYLRIKMDLSRIWFFL